MMNKKKGATNDAENQILASGVNDSLGNVHRYAQFISLQELLKDRHYTPSVENLEKLLYDETILNDQEIRFPLLFEALSVTLFTTKSGKSILQTMKASTSKERKAWEKSFENHDSNYASIIRSWKEDDVLLLKFLRFILANKTTPLQIDRYNLPKYKLPLSFLIVSKVNLPSIILNEGYNMLKDYLYAISGRMEGLIWCNSTFDQSARIFKGTLQQYDRMIEFRNFYFWYSFSAEKNATPKLNHNINLLMDSYEDNLDGVSSVDDAGKSDNHQKQPKDTIIHRTVNDQEQIYSFELNQDGTLQIPNVMEHSLLRHELLFKILNLTPVLTPLLEQQFSTLCGLVDPLTQPTPNDKHIISIDFLYQLFLGLMYPSIKTSQEHNNHYDWKFYICFNMQKIIDATMLRLNCFGFEKLNSINNTDDTVHWRTQLHIWLPHGLNTQDLELLYMIDILAVYTIYKLYEEIPIQLNPFLFSLLSLWKNLSCVILLALEIDRIEEEKGTYETPLMVRATIRGAAALRSVIAAVLNGLVKSNDHDFKHESLNTFMSPYGRKLCHGALYADLRSHTASLLALGASIEDVTDLFADLQSGDRFDEDIRYMFDYECEDYNESFSDCGDEELGEGVNSGEKTKTSIHNGFYQRRCNCIFNDDKLVAEDGANASTNNDSIKNEIRSDGNAGSNTAITNANHATSSINPYSVRSRSTFEFDYSGEDWRDVPKDFNIYYSPSYSFIQEPKLDIIFNLTLRGATEKLSREESVLLVRSVASCVKNEQDQMILADLGSNFTSIGENFEGGDTGITSDKTNDEELRRTTPDDIYEIWSEESAFERMLYVNHDVAWRLMDEMLMCTGYRRILIWFLTHLELKHSLIYYVFELIMGLRGNPFSGEASDQDRKDDMIYEILKKKQKNENTSGLPFSRQGPIVLSDIETKMLLQEFFMNAAIFLSSKNTEEEGEDADKVSLYSLGLVKLICYMVQTLIANDKFFFTKSECTFELQTLLMTWIGILPEAKDLFFQIKSRLAMEEDGITDNTVQHKDKTDLDLDSGKKPNTKSISKLNMKILSLFPSNPTENDDNSAISTLRSFITDYSFDTQVVAPGRRVVFHDDKILPLPKADKPIPLHEYITLAELDMGG